MSAAPVRLKPREWAEAAGLWQSGDVTLGDLSAKYGVSEVHLSRKFKAMGVKKGEAAAEHAQRVQSAAAGRAIQDAALVAQRARQTKEDHYEWAAAMGRMIMHEVVSAKRAGTPIAAIDPTLKSIKRALEGLKIAREERFAALGLDKNDVIDPETIEELPIQEMSAADIERVRSNQIDDALGILEGELDDALDDEEGEGSDLVVEGDD